MNATAILSLLVGVAVGGWLIFGGLAGKLADAVTGGGSDSTTTATSATTSNDAGLVMV